MTEVPAWWPPKVGDKLRMFDRRDDGRAFGRLCHVVSVFDHEDRVRAVIGYYGIHKQWWHYEVISALETWKFWPDGEECAVEELRKQIKDAQERT